MNAVHSGEGNTQFICQMYPARSGMMSSGPTEQEAAILAAHLEYMKGLSEQGIVLLAGCTAGKDGADFGLVVLRAESGETAARLMNNDPAVEQGVIRPALRPYRIALWGTQPAA